MTDIIKNKVSESGLVTIDLGDFYVKGERVLLDIRPLLVEDLLLREKDFREYVKNTDWSIYSGKFVAITCSNDSIIPVWAYMLLTSFLEPYAAKIVFGDLEDLEQDLYSDQLSKINLSVYEGKRVVIKGCGNIEVPVSAFVELTRRLRPFVKSIMYGEPCSTVPVFKAK